MIRFLENHNEKFKNNMAGNRCVAHSSRVLRYVFVKTLKKPSSSKLVRQIIEITNGRFLQVHDVEKS